MGTGTGIQAPTHPPIAAISFASASFHNALGELPTAGTNRLTTWVGNSGLLLVWMSAYLSVSATTIARVGIIVNGADSSWAAVMPNATGSGLLASSTIAALLTTSDGIVPNALNVISIWGVTDSAATTTLNGGTTIVQPL